MIEVEIRAFLTKERFDGLLTFFRKEGTLVKADEQETYYFDCDQDLRIQKNNSGAKIWLKAGNIHDEMREEIEIPCAKEQFPTLEHLFSLLGYAVEVKFFRERNQFDWKGITVCLDYTKGFGHIIELEKLSTEDHQEAALDELKQKLSELNVEHTPREEFQKKYEFYRKNWKSLI